MKWNRKNKPLSSEASQNGTFLKSAIVSFYLVLLLWIIKYIEVKFDISFAHYGILPRQWSGLIGILTSPFIHGDMNHLISNSIPLYFSCLMLLYFFPTIASKVLLLIYLLTGMGVWLIARPTYHIGASGVVYGLVSFLFFSGVFRWDRRLMSLSLLVVFLYGSLVWGLLPVVPDISWESHLMGGVIGALCAFIFRKKGPQPIKYAVDEEEEDTEDEDHYWEEELSEQDEPPKPPKINYIYTPKL